MQWGGGSYYHDSFFETADEVGVLIYHDMQYNSGETADKQFPTATNPSLHFPQNSSLQAAELRYQIRRLSHHPSIAMWDSCNECGAGPDNMDQSTGKVGAPPAGAPRLSRHAVCVWVCVFWGGTSSLGISLVSSHSQLSAPLLSALSTGMHFMWVMETVASEDQSRPIWPASPSTGWAQGVNRLTGLPTGSPLIAGRGPPRPPGLEPLESHGPY